MTLTPYEERPSGWLERAVDMTDYHGNHYRIEYRYRPSPETLKLVAIHHDNGEVWLEDEREYEIIGDAEKAAWKDAQDYIDSLNWDGS